MNRCACTTWAKASAGVVALGAIRRVEVAAVFLLVLGVTLVVGCSAPKPVVPAKPVPDVSSVLGDRTVSVETHTGLRTAAIHHPASAGAGAALVVVLHGESGSGAQARAEYGWDALADREGFVVAYPEAAGQSWNAGVACCGPAHNAAVNDIGFLHQVLTEAAKSDMVNRARVYAVGYSSGAMMAYAWTCARPGELAGIGPVAGGLVSDCQLAAPVSIAAVHGSADMDAPINGGLGQGGLRGVPVPPLEQTLAKFRDLDKCPDQPTTTSGQPVSQRSWACVAGQSVSVAVIEGAAHQWPGSASTAGGATPGPDQRPSAMNATDWLWSHLKADHAI